MYLGSRMRVTVRRDHCTFFLPLVSYVRSDMGAVSDHRLSGLTQTFWYKHHWMRITRTRRALQDNDNVEVLCVRIFARSQDVLNALLLDAKRLYEKEEQHRVSIYTVCSLFSNDPSLKSV